MKDRRDTIKEAVIQMLHHYSRKEESQQVSETTIPVQTMGLDSADGIELACEIQERLKVHLPEAVNPLYDDLARSARSLGEIIDLVCGYERLATEKTS